MSIKIIINQSTNLSFAIPNRALVRRIEPHHQALLVKTMIALQLNDQFVPRLLKIFIAKRALGNSILHMIVASLFERSDVNQLAGSRNIFHNRRGLPFFTFVADTVDTKHADDADAKESSKVAWH